MKRALDSNEKVEAKTLAEVAYRLLRADILWGRAVPGSPLRSAELQVSYGMGISPLREALSRLVSEGLVTTEGQRGFRVAPISAEDVEDILVTRLTIESEALRRSIAFGDDEWEGGIVAAFHLLSRIAVPNEPGPDAETWARRHRDFHVSLIAASRAPMMLRFAGVLFDNAERYRVLRVLEEPEPNLSRDVEAEHKALMDATLQRDADAAVSALRLHYQQTADYAIAALSRLKAV